MLWVNDNSVYSGAASYYVSARYDGTGQDNLLVSMQNRMTDELINSIAASLDVSVDEGDLETRFKSLYTAFQYGAPPHGGYAPGLDRILMLLKDEENLREVQVFPPNVNGMDNMMGSPSPVTEQQLREVHIKVRNKNV